MLTFPVWRLLLSQRLMVDREIPKSSETSFLGMPRSMAQSTFNLRSFEYAFMDNIFLRVHYLRKPLLGRLEIFTVVALLSPAFWRRLRLAAQAAHVSISAGQQFDQGLT